MAFSFKPAIGRGTSVFELPRPVPVLRIQDSWDGESYKVPLLDGEERVGISRQGPRIILEGQFGSASGSLTVNEEEMFTKWLELRTQSDAGTSPFEFFIYFDSGSGVYRKLKDCSTLRLECDLSRMQLFEYSMVIQADDPTIYQTGPGL